MKLGSLSLLAFFMSSAGTAAYASAADIVPEELDDTPPPDDPRPHVPPPEVFAACESKAAGDACTVTLHGREHAGTCLAPPPDAPDTRLACLPKDRPPRPNGPAH